MMTKRLILILMVIIITGFYFFNYKKNNSNENLPNLNYQEPTPNFFDAGAISSQDIVVKITDLGFEPETITIKKGDKVTWINSTSGYAWPASNPHPTHTDYSGSTGFDPQLPMKINQAWSFTFDKVGTFGYHDHLHPIKRGVVHVEK